LQNAEKVDAAACIWYNIAIKYRRQHYDETATEVGNCPVGIQIRHLPGIWRKFKVRKR
jgi:N-acetylmuramoyl-L-alanine amidase CwlA